MERKANIVSFEFKYILLDDESVLIPESMIKDYEKNSPGKEILSGVLNIKIPDWTDIYEIERKSKGYSRAKSANNPLGIKKMRVFLPDKLKFWKIRILCDSLVDHDGTIYNLNDDFVKNLDITFAKYILEKIDKVISQANIEDLPKEDGDTLSMDCYNYFSKLKKSAKDPKIEVPEPPAIILLMKLSKLLGLSFDEIRKMDKKLIDSIFVARHQENLCENPALLGQGKPIPVNPKMLQNTEAKTFMDKKEERRKEKYGPQDDNKKIPKLYQPQKP